MQSKEIKETEMLTQKIYRIQEYILTEIKEKGEISDFKEDVMYVIHNLLERQLNKEEQTACEIVMKNQEARIQTEQKKQMQMKIDQLENKVKELEKENTELLEVKISASAHNKIDELERDNLKLRTELENKRKEYQETYKDVREELKELKKANINKQVIRDKIEELNKEEKEIYKKDIGNNELYRLKIIDEIRSALQELHDYSLQRNREINYDLYNMVKAIIKQLNLNEIEIEMYKLKEVERMEIYVENNYMNNAKIIRLVENKAKRYEV